MWLSRPLYESLPYIYMIVGVLLLSAAWFVDARTLPSVLMIVGALSTMGGLVLWLRRRDYRSRQSEYDHPSLDE